MAGIEDQLRCLIPPRHAEHARCDLVQERVREEVTALGDDEVVGVIRRDSVYEAPDPTYHGPRDAPRAVIAAAGQRVPVTGERHQSVRDGPGRWHVVRWPVERPGQVPPDRVGFGLSRPLTPYVDVESPDEGAATRQAVDVMSAQGDSRFKRCYCPFKTSH